MKWYEILIVGGVIALVCASAYLFVKMDKNVPLEHRKFHVTSKQYIPSETHPVVETYTDSHGKTQIRTTTEYYPAHYYVWMNVEGEAVQIDDSHIYGTVVNGDEGVCACKHGGVTGHLYVQSWCFAKRPAERE